MKLYKLQHALLIEHDHAKYLLKNHDWDTFVNDDLLFEKLNNTIAGLEPLPPADAPGADTILPPIGHQEVWASGVTYYNSKLGREAESKDAGGGAFYAHVYEAKRPELFFKSAAHRVIGPAGQVRIRQDSTWNVPEPELTLMISSSGKIIGYTIGNDMSSRSIEGENPLYLPQAKCYNGSTALGPCLLVQSQPMDKQTKISMQILRQGKEVFSGEVSLDQIKRTFDELVHYLYLECSFPVGCLLMTGTGIVPGPEFTLQSGDEIKISITGIGMLTNTVS